MQVGTGDHEFYAACVDGALEDVGRVVFMGLLVVVFAFEDIVCEVYSDIGETESVCWDGNGLAVERGCGVGGCYGGLGGWYAIRFGGHCRSINARSRTMDGPGTLTLAPGRGFERSSSNQTQDLRGDMPSSQDREHLS